MLPYGSGNTPDITETPLQRMIISGTWMAMMTPVHSRRSFVVEPQTSILIPFAYMILAMSEIWSSVSEYLVRSRFRHYYFTRSRDLSSQWPSHKLRNLDVISPSGPRVSLHHLEWTILYLDPSPQPTSLKYPRHTFMTTLLQCGVWCSQSIPRRWRF